MVGTLDQKCPDQFLFLFFNPTRDMETIDKKVAFDKITSFLERIQI